MEKVDGVDLFSGNGRISNALSPWVRTRVYCENDGFNQSQLLSRMSRGELEIAPIWDDVNTLPGWELPFKAGIIKAGFPCQPFSTAGAGKGVEDDRGILFYQVVRVAQETRSPFIFLENVPAIRTRGQLEVSKELARCGYDQRWCVVSAREVGANHKRERWFCLAHPSIKGLEGADGEKLCESRLANQSKELANTLCAGLYRETAKPKKENNQRKWENYWRSEAATYSRSWWKTEPSVGRVADGGTFRRDEVRSLGNSVVALQVQTAFKRLLGIEKVEKGKVA